ncbi:N-terminal nucleophile aminohydrolase [Cucurbitaria berberidis CBS 394.84]|uniref:N-terminal nucleophile aminohydrolase n=1 Tax=Cucurbitaria berberidis CBS 394.84 TaxID=1168544 RepID=A0A9P4GS80_9PLEO|nr:N-terminal nucleophile aminohydrolase [Cucurbitaria berberidis CBS 394.84]KAF1850390.1 N-terminal nucleophile aminohydrolase [Cucurbitaria berberidis CBS 394.84]
MSKEYKPAAPPGAPITPRIVIHGGAGNLTKATIPRDRYNDYQASLNRILAQSADLLAVPGMTALDVATYAVTQLENDPLYNSGKGAVFTREGRNELECSIMVSNGYKKRGVGCMMLKHVKNPIKLARELLIRGEDEDGGGAKDHCQYSGEFVESLAQEWGLEIVGQEYFFTQNKWDEHKRGLAEEKKQEERGLAMDETSDWEKENYISLGTCGAVVLDSFGTICTATSTGGLTNKVPGRVGDTPTMGTGYWAEEWSYLEEQALHKTQMLYQPSLATSPVDKLSRGDIGGLVGDCLPSFNSRPASATYESQTQSMEKPTSTRHAVGLSGTGNGDTFIRLCAARTTAAKSRFTSTPLSTATSWMAGPGGELQKSAGDRWGKTHEGVGGLIGIELVGKKAEVVFDFNCGGMFRAWTEEGGTKRCLIFREDSWESGPEGWGSI